MADLQQIRFESPPVRTVRLALYFKMSEPMLSYHAGSLFDLWSSEYPVAEELPPRAPVGGDPEDVSLLDESSSWPPPFVTFENPDSGRSVFYQQDRFGLLWEFNSQSQNMSYPGFETLSEELFEKYETFCSMLSSRGAGTPELHGAECMYINEIENVGIGDYIVGLLSGWQSPGAGPSRPADESISFSRHLHGDGNSERPIWIVATGNGQDPLDLRLTARVEDAASLSERDALSLAHDILIDSFVQSTSNEMRASWGKA